MLTAEFELVLFGGLGDLASRKLLPALYFLAKDQRLASGRIYLLTRQPLEAEVFAEKVSTLLRQFIEPEHLDENLLAAFLPRLSCVQIEVNQPDSFERLKRSLSAQVLNRIIYLATGSELYIPICQGLQQAGLIHQHTKLVLEKPIGHDFASAEKINQSVKAFFKEEQIFRIDHYLGKETVQNLLVLRFANSIFEHQWNQNYIDHIQITIAETIGVENRAGFYEHVGAMRDMLQNHLLQLLCMTAMEPPAKLDADSIRDEKVKVLKALKPISGSQINESIVCGQYAGYRQEPGVNKDSSTETFVAAKVEIENWRWAGVPFYLRTGKCLPERACEIVVYFKTIPHSIFPLLHKDTLANKLTFRLQPDEGVRLSLCEKRVGAGMNVRPMNLSLNPSANRPKRVPEAYERLLYDVIQNNQTLFLRHDELLAAWRWIDPILNFWQQEEQRPEPYAAGSWGPSAATLMLARDSRLWDENS